MLSVTPDPSRGWGFELLSVISGAVANDRSKAWSYSHQSRPAGPLSSGHRSTNYGSTNQHSYRSNHTYAETVPMNRKVVPMQFGRDPVSSSKCQWRHAQVPLH